MIKTILITLALGVLLGGCSAKEFNAGADSIMSDVANAFENSRDKSQD
ncbi:MAG: hypothetical protein Q9M40_01805 [Sulfurimonas sp.]|nr:hypothetical protein [Sulfurimonas sp.]MDQ7066822.1 hypothetical protein [Sulfurimonas sp.]